MSIAVLTLGAQPSTVDLTVRCRKGRKGALMVRPRCSSLGALGDLLRALEVPRQQLAGPEGARSLSVARFEVS